MSRTKASLKNFIWSNMQTLVYTILKFVLRTIFIKTLGATYLGVDSLLLNILGFLSLAELGISTAISFSLYKPIAENNIRKIQALINFFRKAYRIVALVVLTIGLIIVPLIPKIAKGSESVSHLQIIFCIYLFNTVSSYLITYKATIISADQKAYIQSNVNIVTNFVTIILQSISLVVFKNYIIYLIIASVTGLLSNIFLNRYAGKLYPYIRKRNNEKLTKEESGVLFKKIKALLYHRIGQVVISQTDSIIISSVINVTMVGLIANYNMIINTIKTLSSSLFDVMVPSLGNLYATEDKDHIIRVYKNVEFINYWIDCFASISLFFLLTPFIKIWAGEKYVIDEAVVFLLVLNFYIYISRLPIFSVRSAAGVFEPDRFSPILESIINLIVSVVLAKFIGVVGVYVGTLVSSFIPYVWCPLVVHKYVFNCSSSRYFLRQFLKLVSVFLCGLIMKLFFNYVCFDNLYLNLLFRGAICIIVPNIMVILIYYKRDEFKYACSVFNSFIRKLKNYDN